jgi:hypothetical protein
MTGCWESSYAQIKLATWNVNNLLKNRENKFNLDKHGTRLKIAINSTIDPDMIILIYFNFFDKLIHPSSY